MTLKKFFWKKGVQTMADIPQWWMKGHWFDV
jgi:hypothetical protein